MVMGFGDVKFVVVIGVFLGWEWLLFVVVVVIFVGVVLGLV